MKGWTHRCGGCGEPAPPPRRASVADLENDVERSRVREMRAHVEHVRAVEYRVRMEINLELARKRERGESEDNGE